jgi:endonuclease I/V8-like Glu-specific endopeptidase
MYAPKQIARTEQRYAERTPERVDAEAKIARGEILEADSPARVRMRLERMGVPPDMASAAIAAEDAEEVERRAVVTPVAPAPAPVVNALERILGTSDLISARFLSDGARVARSVCRIEIIEPNGLVAGYGTGVMISPRLLLTNNHVLETAATAAGSVAEFGYVEGDDDRALPAVRFALEPDAFFATDPALDYTAVAVRDRSVDGQPLSTWGWVPLIAQQGKVIKGEMVNIVQHPGGEPKQVALRENQVVDLLADFLHYRTDTAPGSSGAPVFNDEWEMVALHHSGVPARDASGRLLAIDGSLWTEAMGEHRLRWVANEGARVSRVVSHLHGQALGAIQRDLLAQTLTPPEPPVEAAGTSGIAGRPLVAAADAPSRIDATVAADGATWTIPLQVSVRVGTPLPSATAGASTPSTPDGEPVADDASVTAALDALDRARDRPYYDEAADAAARDRYYADVPKRLNASKRFATLGELVRRTHTTQPRYEPRRHVYPWVDLQPNGMLRSIYTGEEYAPEEFIREDARIDRERATRLTERLTRESSVDPREAIDLLEAALPYNCEHVVPQSWFGKREPMRGDLHHLFACESRCNSFRGNTPYFEFPEFDEALRPGCGMVEDDRFEPSHGKGAAARAVFYFLLRYPGEIGRAEGYDEDRLALLLEWHRQEPPGDYERHRNAAIFEASGNRNPLIDFPDWAGKIDLAAGLG